MQKWEMFTSNVAMWNINWRVLINTFQSRIRNLNSAVTLRFHSFRSSSAFFLSFLEVVELTAFHGGYYNLAWHTLFPLCLIFGSQVNALLTFPYLSMSYICVLHFFHLIKYFCWLTWFRFINIVVRSCLHITNGLKRYSVSANLHENVIKTIIQFPKMSKRVFARIHGFSGAKKQELIKRRRLCWEGCNSFPRLILVNQPIRVWCECLNNITIISTS